MAFVHGLLGLGFFATLLVAVPRFKRIFADFAVRLPAATELAVNLSDLAVEFWYAIFVAFAVVLALDAALMVWLRRRTGSRALVWVWFLLVLFLGASLLAYTWTTLLAPLAELTDGLSR
ncbi:MAG: hypothetical protein K2R98_16095 [Gemmataceae bacterium]|nr:hypothetical protein [Gemmataceae bacterium]